MFMEGDFFEFSFFMSIFYFHFLLAFRLLFLEESPETLDGRNPLPPKKNRNSANHVANTNHNVLGSKFPLLSYGRDGHQPHGRFFEIPIRILLERVG